ncbi:uncharacterized protein ARMOST_15745 [Armillaria ostoyae]|uniref:F-box domain-containing protein n=1 Tax=Armillaria ostoyae TaxID=47428 RepID=A0A284RUA9_ARMOS|nr:uncharacterized protein ARMOST_15745 [Armillaria ostoyae]
MACISSQQVPQELINNIVNELHDHRKSLKACKSVCRAFRSPAEAILFRRVSLSRSASISRLFKVSPGVLNSVREATIYESVESMDADVMTKAIAALVKLNTIEVTRMTWVPNTYHITPAVVSVLRTLPIKTLTLDEVIFRDIVQFAGFMDTFPGVENISLEHVYCHIVSKNDKAPVSSRTNVIRSLHLSVNEISSNILRAVADGSLGSLAELKSLTCVGNPKGKEVPPLFALVQNPSLQDLCVNGDIPVVNLSHIKTLVIHLAKVAYTQEFCTSLSHWTDCLACGEESSLNKITIHLDVKHQLSVNDAKQWAVLDKVLSASRFPELASFRVILKVAGGIDAEQTKELIKTHCPTLCTRNVCTLEVEGSSDTQNDVESDSESADDDNESTGGDNESTGGDSGSAEGDD